MIASSRGFRRVHQLESKLNLSIASLPVGMICAISYLYNIHLGIKTDLLIRKVNPLWSCSHTNVTVVFSQPTDGDDWRCIFSSENGIESSFLSPNE